MTVALPPPTPMEVWALAEYRSRLEVVKRQFAIHPKGSLAVNYAAAIILHAEQQYLRRLGTMTVEMKTGKDFDFDSWVNVRLTEEDKSVILDLSERMTPDSLLDWVASQVFAGYSFSCSWDAYSEANQVSLVCKAVKDPNYGLGLSARNPDFFMALLTLVHKNDNILRGKWSDAPPTPSGNSWG